MKQLNFYHQKAGLCLKINSRPTKAEKAGQKCVLYTFGKESPFATQFKKEQTSSMKYAIIVFHKRVRKCSLKWHRPVRYRSLSATISKGQIKSEWIYEFIDFPNCKLKNFKDFCPKSLFEAQSKISTYILITLSTHGKPSLNNYARNQVKLVKSSYILRYATSKLSG